MKMFDIDKYIRKLFTIFRLQLEEGKKEAIVQFIKFGIVGITNTLISYFIYIAVIAILSPLQLAWDYFVGNITSFILSVLWSFYWNNKYVFSVDSDEKRSVGKALLKTYISYGFTGILLNNVLSWIWISLLGISKLFSPFINLLISVPLNFVINKFWAFKSVKNG